MVIFLQLGLFFIAFLLRGYYLFGTHLRTSKLDRDILTYTGRSKHGIQSRHIGVKRKEGIPFDIRQENFFHEALKNMGIASEIKISDSGFDKKYFISTDYPDHLEKSMASGRLLKSLNELFKLPVRSLHAT